MFILVATSDLEEADGIPNSSVEEMANDEGSAHWLAIQGLEAFAHDDDGIELIYRDEDVGSVTLEGGIRIGMGTLEDVEEDDSTAAAVASEETEEEDEE